MFLKSIEIQGFKSFPDQSIMNFGRGITAVVGPNGSGKSNIVDAIRWVLGEQSTKTLRGGKMEDVIFGGTARRKPLGFCQVTLTMDNTDGGLPVDFAEVTVTRRYYRSGESEFYINRKAVRLKDVHELFMDTGLGRDGYSVIGQGRIDEILSVKSADRREIFEEAAGITKFRYRKEESERKLGACEENLVRIRDIITELEGQVATLQEQAERAKSYLIFRDELRVLEVNVWLDSLEKLKDHLHQAQTDYANAERMLSARKREAEELQDRTERLTEELHQKDLDGERVRDEVHACENRESELRSRIAVDQTQLRNQEETVRIRQKEMELQTHQGGDLQAQKAERIGRQSELALLTEALKEQLETQLEAVRRAAEEGKQIADELEALNRQTEASRNAVAVLREKDTALNSAIQEIHARGGNIGTEVALTRSRLEEEQQKARELRCSLEENEEKKQSAENMLRGFALREQTRRKKLEELTKKAEQLSRTAEGKAQRLELLCAMEREYEGFGQAVRRVMQAAGRKELSGIHGPVSTLIRTEDEYSVAIEIALGAAMQNIVVEDEACGKTAIQFLKSRDYGRATFLPMTAVRDRHSGRSPEGAGFLGWADELVRREARYDRVVRSLLAGTAVVDHMDHAIALAKKNGYGFRIVTLDGQLINPSGAMTGGSLNKNTGVLSRSNEISRLRQELTDLAAQQQQLEQACGAAKQELESVNYESKVAQDELRQAQDALLELSAFQKQHLALTDALEQRLEDLDTEQHSQSARIAQIEAQRDMLQSQIREEEQNMAALAQQQSDLEHSRSIREQNAAEHTQKGADLRVQIARNDTEQDSITAALADLDARIAHMGEDLSAKQAETEELQKQNAALRQSIEDQQALSAVLAQQTEQKRALLQAVNEQKMNLEGERQRCDKELRLKNEELIHLERERGRLETRKTQAEMEEDGILQKLWESYELTRVTAEELRTELESVPKANRRIGELRLAMKKLGSVNLDSIEEYSKVRERYDFMTGQRDDLEKSKAELLKIIADLTKNMKEIFSQQFRRINESFQKTFTEIFGGGSADLKLEDESDILSCGIEIRVELPGKSMRAISLLSGGEKAFVAIALYFAIIKVRPTPFCVLDEIDAALDDVNVNRYAEYMRTLCQQTQFIIITHRRGSMEGSDILYGVTMQEQGVTKLLALHINEIEEQIKEKLSES